MASIIQDISHYQQAVDFNLLYLKGQRYIIPKAYNGSGHEDDMFESHYTNGIAAGMRVASYLWNDGIYDAVTQAKGLLETIKGKDIAFIMIDFEQWWSNWDLYMQYVAGIIPQSAVPKLSSAVILKSLQDVYAYIYTNSDLNIIIYSAAWFINSYCSQAWDYLKDKYTNWMDYNGFNYPKMYKTWEQLEAIAPIGKPISGLPLTYPADKILMRQWSGDTFTSDGVWGDKQKLKLSALDLNLWISSTISIENFCKPKGVIIVPTPTTKPTFVQSTNSIWNLNVPYVSQLGTGADQYNNDCGAACGCMIVKGYTDTQLTVNEFYKATGQVTDAYLNATQIINTLSKFGVVSSWKISNLATLLSDLHSGRPCICLILYSVLVDAGLTQNTTFRGFHFVTAMGYDAKNIYIHDPLWIAEGGKEVAVPQGTFDKAWLQAGSNPSLNPAYGCIMPATVLGQPISIAYTNYKVIASQLNVRSTPNSDNSSNIVGALYYGNIVPIESINADGWGKIYLKSQFVYMTWLVKAV